ncbi:hypothetical protein ABPG75_004603, partial [Micractinium tetrahymenae]
ASSHVARCPTAWIGMADSACLDGRFMLLPGGAHCRSNIGERSGSLQCDALSLPGRTCFPGKTGWRCCMSGDCD